MSKPRLQSIDQLAPANLRARAEEVEIGEFSVLVWPVTGKPIQKWSKDNATIKGGKVVRLNTDTSTARLLALCIRDDDGRQYLSLADINLMIEEQSAADIARLDKVARRLNGLLDEEDDEDEGSEDGDVAGNGSTPRTPSRTDWPLPSVAAPSMSS